jgi:hypothetical protein
MASPQDSPASAGVTAYGPAIIGAVLCVSLIRSGFLTFFFLLPLGFIAVVYNLKTLGFSVFAAILGNGFFSLALILLLNYSGGALAWDILYFTVTALVFGWIMAPSGGTFRVLRIPRSYRFILGAAAEALVFLFIFAAAGDNSEFKKLLLAQAEMITSFYISSSGSDVVQRSLLERYLTPEVILETLRVVALRGGGIAACLFIFFISRQLSLFIARFTRQGRSNISAGDGIIRFHTSPRLIWVLSCSLFLVLGARLIKIEILEILAWNFLTLCAVLYLAQGSGIVLHFFAQAPLPPFLRLVLNVLIFFVILSPGINAFALGVVTLLGIAENWVPFRAPKPHGPSSTPGI